MSWKFSCQLCVGSDHLDAQEIFHSGWMDWDWGRGAENTLVGEVTRLHIRHGAVQNRKLVRARFLATPSALLRSADIISRKDAKVSIDKIARDGPRCSITRDVDLLFSTAYSIRVDGEVESNLQALVSNPSAISDFNAVHSFLRDLLVLASFAERRHIICTEWELECEDGAQEHYFQRDFTPSAEEEKIDIDETLIPLADIEAFLNDSMSKFGKLNHQSPIKQAIYFALSAKEPGIENVYMVLFAGIETLLNRFRSEHSLERVIAKSDWKQVQPRILGLLRGEKAFSDLLPDAQIAMEQRVPELNRISFPTAFKKMCVAYGVELTDLWPMVGAGAVTLYSLRNSIVHGRVFPHEADSFRLVSAKFHLSWTLERTILQILGWPIAMSRVSARSLNLTTPYQNWKEDQQYFASVASG